MKIPTYSLRLIVLAIVVSFLTSCGGGLNCPFNRPSCCDNALFGCGPFDLPEGCSCGDFFGGSLRSRFTVKQGRFVPMSVESAGGKWRVSMQRRSSTCAGLRSSLVSNVKISQTSNRIVLQAPGVATLRGTRSGNTVTASGQYTPMLILGCNAQITSEMKLTSATTADVTGSVNMNCRRAANSCNARFSGKAVKLPSRR
jgi:hypothetical protein